MGKPITPERLASVRGMRRARRLYRKQPLFAFDILQREYPGYTPDEFWDDLRYRRPPKRRKGKTPLARYGRWRRMEKLKAMYGNTGNIDYALQALRLRRHMTDPYRVLVRVGDEISEYGFSPLIPIERIEQLTAEVRSCRTETEIGEMVRQFRERTYMFR